MNARTIRMMTAAAVLGAAGYAHAQTAPREGGWREPPSRPGATQPAPAPPTKQPGAAVQQPAAAASQLTERQQQLLGTLHTRDMILVDAGILASQKGTSAEVKQLGNQLVSETRAVDDQMKQLVGSRGSNVDTLPVMERELTGFRQKLAQLGTLSGAEFDREFILAIRDLQAGYVEDLKKMRDETPGKDAELKGWLDATENVAENQLTASRQVKQALDAQRAAKR